jgi:hypothetical protein
MSVGAMISVARDAVTTAVADSLKTLMEQKHLYQGVSIDINGIVSAALRTDKAEHPSDSQSRQNAAGIVSRAAHARWLLYPSREAQIGGAAGAASPIVVELRPFRMFCARCTRRERYEVVRADDFAFDVYRQYAAGEFHLPQWPLADQAFVISALCQGCKNFPEVLLIRRTTAKNRLTLSGRTPLEAAEVQANLPDPEVSFFRDAVVAHQSGKTLAGLFFLRTFTEQFARRVIGESGRRSGEEIMDAYNKTLPDAIRPMIPSLGDCYGRLSEALHAGRGDDALFDEMRGRIEQHFDFRAASRI